MDCNEFVSQICEESRIHGCKYIAKTSLHWTERVFWLGTVLTATCLSLKICINQWQRFLDSPLINEVGMIDTTKKFPEVGTTLCIPFFDADDLPMFIEKYWNLTEDAPKYKYYAGFLKTLSDLDFHNFLPLKKYENDETIGKYELLDILMEIRMEFAYDDIDGYYLTISERGICRTTSLLRNFISHPFVENVSVLSDYEFKCDVYNECFASATPTVGDDIELALLVHDREDVPTFMRNETETVLASPFRTLQTGFEIDTITTEDDVRKLSISSRKCRYKDENNLKYYPTYRPSLCRMECRIDAALSQCGCKPYFYMAAPMIPFCNISGMICLQNNKWQDTACHCLPLCEYSNFIMTFRLVDVPISAGRARAVTIKQSMKKYALRRRVIFSFDQLIVSFGGAIGLFIGASMFTIYGIFIVIWEFLVANSLKVCKRNTSVIKPFIH